MVKLNMTISVMPPSIQMTNTVLNEMKTCSYMLEIRLSNGG